ncbi:Similar to Long-chain-fatty-acid--CoA ligase 3; acc. no. O95573 [Pyronema omphalodes CBS 100304]|uniref:Similar to Long-chain-fatty-acid--CoA ligase 3 acc. no. O95573 n=1 Tax=Pyronema omphalodes (strain CBS 100304) TaxID=1076935 RepID=U4LFR9_PYROM|nr:Similar to Long-chain-fatty-acid--CoA ligase 3; acc. no. O95573 [Pyronema omphalodes CBS 100304]
MSGGIELQFDLISYTLIALLVGLIVVPLILSKDPDIHPYALLRQSSVAPVRNPKESAVYRSLQTPVGYPLVSGLQLPSVQKYSSRSGDIRDIWKLAIEKGKGKIIVAKGKDVEKHDINTLTKQIHALGTHLKNAGATKVAVHLPNCIENLVATFACAYYGFVLVILPFEPTGTPSISELLKQTSADILITQGGQLPLEEFKGSGLKEIVLVVEEASQHLGWSGPIGEAKCGQFVDITKNEVEPIADIDIDLDAPAVVIFSPEVNGKIETVEFSHRNIIAGVAALAVTLPKNERYMPEDVFLPVDTLADLYTRIHLYTALSSGTTVALNSTGGKHADVELTCRVIAPTIIVVSPESLLEMHRATKSTMKEFLHGIVHYFQTKTLADGRIPQGNFLTNFGGCPRPNVGGKLRLVFVVEAAGDKTSQAITSLDLSDARVFFKSKVVYGLKHHKVAGPLAQQNVYDYRVQAEALPSEKNPRKCAHFGPPTPGVEIKLRDMGEFTATDAEGPRGEVMISGAPVSGGQQALGFAGKWEKECVLSYA